LTVRATFAAVLGLALGATNACADDLLQVYRDAQRYDATYAGARNTLEAGREKLPQGRALLLPTLNLSANATKTQNELDSKDPSVTPSFDRKTRV
jgi:outer membrane protein